MMRSPCPAVVLEGARAQAHGLLAQYTADGVYGIARRATIMFKRAIGEISADEQCKQRAQCALDPWRAGVGTTTFQLADLWRG